ncbi:DNA polymerase delta small subunit [Ostreococcus tauri]|uniref:DNA polymerase delta small subunit n=1 Tax=Ostreococcus tauri TaxID=70448 RepID=A0A1Y5I110_OSTTA|nr:DNA polymerase delta small subunit [Ostreococcus tauri]
MACAVERARGTRDGSTTNEKYALTGRVDHGQYYQLYYNRLMALKPRAVASARARWPNAPVRGVLELKEHEPCVVVGTVYKEMKDKPIILDEYVKDFEREVYEAKRIERGNYCREDDRLEFEDEGARVRVLGVDAGRFVTGVDAVTTADGDAKYVCLVSGLELGGRGSSAENLARNQMFVDYVTGASVMDSDAASDCDAAHICQVVVAGGTLNVNAPSLDDSTASAAASAAAVKELDLMFTEIASAVPVDVMSGKSDPTNKAMPQQPLHPVYFTEATRFEKTMRLATNPHEFSVDNISFLGTSGQNVDDVLTFSTIGADDVSSSFSGDDAAKPAVAALSQTLRWQHVAPSAPDTLACYPFKDRDPFVIDTIPRVYFAGCQEAFGADRVAHERGETLVVSVPRFSTTGCVVLIDVRTLECRVTRLA